MRSCWAGSEKGREDSVAGGQEENRGGGAGLGKPCGLCTRCAALLRDGWQQLAVPSGAWPAQALPNWPWTFVHLSLLFHPLVTHPPHSISATQLLFAFQNPVPCQLLWRACWPQPLALTSLAPHWIFRVPHRRTTVMSCLVSLSISRTQAYLCHWFLISSWTS